MQRGRFYLTEKGRDLLAYCQTGEPLNFTRAAIGTGKIESTAALFVMINSLKRSKKLISEELRLTATEQARLALQ